MRPLAERSQQPTDPASDAEPESDATSPFEALYEGHVDFVWRAARRLGVAEEDADDMVQEVFFIAHRRLSDFEGRASAKTWLFGILHHVVQHHRRSRARKQRHLVAEGARLDPDRLPDLASPGPAQSAEHAQAMRILDRLLSTLDDEKRAVFVLAEIEQMTATEIAEALAINPNTVYSRLRVARLAFDRALERYKREEARSSHE